jgi:hypothetical protein
MNASKIVIFVGVQAVRRIASTAHRTAVYKYIHEDRPGRRTGTELTRQSRKKRDFGGIHY